MIFKMIEPINCQVICNFKKLTFFSISANSSHGTTSSGSGSGQPTAAANAALAAAQWSHQGRQGQYLFICSLKKNS